MPNWFPSWTNCCPPATYRGAPWAGVLTHAGVSLLMAVLVGLVALSPAIAIGLAGLCIAGMEFCTWWLDVRLICLGGDRSAIGAIYHLEPPEPTDNPITALWNISDLDTDYSFNLLLWQFVPKHQFPASFVSNQWSAGAFPQLGADWPALPPLVPAVPFPEVSPEVNLIVAQQSMASLGLGFAGENAEPGPDQAILPGGSNQHFLLHCEIEGPGMHDLLVLLWVLFGIFVAAAFVYAIPIVGPVLSWILVILGLLGFLGGVSAITHDDASPPGGDWGGSFNSYDQAKNPKDPVDIAYVFGRWVYDSLHTGGNELHPVHYMIKMGQTTQGDLAAGNWPPDLGDTQLKYDAQFEVINSPSTIQIQGEPQNSWTVHPLLDGCEASMPYPEPPPPV
jgi:hypothetical protein